MTSTIPRTPAICSPYVNEPPPEVKKQHIRRRTKQVLAKALNKWLGSDFIALM